MAVPLQVLEVRCAGVGVRRHPAGVPSVLQDHFPDTLGEFIIHVHELERAVSCAGGITGTVSLATNIGFTTARNIGMSPGLQGVL